MKAPSAELIIATTRLIMLITSAAVVLWVSRFLIAITRATIEQGYVTIGKRSENTSPMTDNTSEAT
ncbi:MAG: hypothetical protein FWD05_11905 [Oscillospiraceae bacterium]|nr:hypothetical protein [Oscillospiraceae bacterium]